MSFGLVLSSSDSGLGAARAVERWLSEVFPDQSFRAIGPNDDLREYVGGASMAIIIAAPGSRGGKKFWIDWGRVSQTLDIENIFLLELGPSSLGLPIRRFDIRRTSLERFFSAIAEQLGLPVSSDLHRRIARFEDDVQEYLPEWADDERRMSRSAASIDIGDPVALAVGRHLSEAVRLDSDVSRLINLGISASMFADDDSCRPVYIPLNIYVSDWDPGGHRGDSLFALIASLIKNLDLEVVAQLPTIYGSRWERFVLKVRSVAGSSEVRQKSKKILREIEYGLKQATLASKQAEIDNVRADTFLKIVQGLGERNGVIQFGSMMVYKDDEKILAKSLTVDEMLDREEGHSLEEFVSSVAKSISQAKDEGVESALPPKPTTPELGTGVDDDVVDDENNTPD